MPLKTAWIYLILCMASVTLGDGRSCDFSRLAFKPVDGSILRNPAPLTPLLKQKTEAYAQARKAHGDTPEAIVALYKDREFLPEGATIHVMGPSFNIYEWAIPLMYRPDVKIIVSEPDTNQFESIPKIRSGNTWAFEDMKAHHPKLLADAGVTTPKQFLDMVNQRVWWLNNAYDTHFKAGAHPSVTSPTPVPKADLVFARLPQSAAGPSIPKHLKPGGFAWVQTEGIFTRLRPPEGTTFVPVTSPVGEFLPRGNVAADEPGRFRGMDFGESFFVDYGP